MFVERYLKEVRAAGYTRAAWLRYCRRVGRMVWLQVWHNPQATRSVLTVGITLFMLHLVAAFGLSFALGAERSVTYLWSAGLVTLAGTLLCLLHLSLVRTRDGIPCARLSAADWLTLARLTMAPGAFLFAEMGAWKVALAWIVVGGLTDVADGVVARRLGVGTRLGIVLDPLVDIVFNICMFAGLLAGGLAPAWVMALVVVRYTIVVVGAVYIYVTRGPVRIRPTAFGKGSGVVIFALVGGLAAVAAFGGPALAARAAPLLEVGLTFLCVGTVIHVIVMGWNNVKLTAAEVEPPKVLADVAFRASSRRREP